MRTLLALGLTVLTASAGCAVGRAASPTPVAVAPRPAVAPVEPQPAPSLRRVVVTKTEISILEPIEFIADSTAITLASQPMIDAMSWTLTSNESLRLVEIGVTIGDGVVADRDERARLALDRATVIVEALVARGVARERLVPTGTIDAPSTTSLSILDRSY